jgi:DNA topoisomerase-3
MKALVLAEKPSVAREIARVLGCTQKHKNYMEGPRYVVTWALGHLVELAEPEDYDSRYKTWSLDDLPILPKQMKLKVIRETSHQFRAIEQLARRSDLDELVIATDAGREGELVARWIMEMIRWRKPFKRLWISSQTDQAIREGFARLKPGEAYNPLYQSAVCRAEADWYIGLNVTRALTSKYNAQLAAGRVQTPTLAMLMAREREIRQFQPKPYWTLQADFGTLKAQWRHPKSGDSRLFDEKQAEALQQKLQNIEARVVQVRTAAKQEPQPLAYDLTELQRDANRRFGFSAKQTLNYLQRLYEEHKLVTYPRTDSRYLSSDMVPTLPGRLQAIARGPYAELAKPLLRKPLPITRRIVDDSKISDHHAIIPTEQYLHLEALKSEERKLYDLIARRFISLFYPVHRFEDTTYVIEAAGETLHAFGRIVREPGWKEVYGASYIEDPEEEGTGEHELQAQLLPGLQEGDRLRSVRCQMRGHSTRPPARYTEAALLSQMEKHHLGTPATRADIIEKLVSTDTIERQGQHLVPTGKGSQLIELAAEELRSPELTAKWELELEQIAKGRGNWQAFLDEIRRETERLVNEIKASSAEYKPHNVTRSKCPSCGKYLLEIKSKRGRMLVCPDKSCGHRHAAEPPLSGRRCPQCHKRMEIHEGKAGRYVQCRSCNVVEKLDGQGGRRQDRRKQQQLIRQYSDNVKLTSSLADALKAAMEKNGE